jgi:phosphoribosyl-AMP cyclohydrolase/RimJ/RimL family protein N-acetyltransferase
MSKRHLAGLREAIEASLPELRPWMPWADSSAEETAAFIRTAVRGWREGTNYVLVMVFQGRPVGTISLRVEALETEMGYWVTTAAAGRGLVTEAGRRLVDLAFEDLGVARLGLLAGAANRASCRAAAKIGFRYEGFAPAAAFSRAGRYDCNRFGLSRAEWERSREAGSATTGEALSPATGLTSSPSTPREPDFRQGLITAVVQDATDGAVLMVAHMDAEAYRRTVETGRAWFWSRSRAELWEKGATSGNRLDVVSMAVDCDGDSLLLRVRPAGPACHSGARSCFDPPPGV